MAVTRRSSSERHVPRAVPRVRSAVEMSKGKESLRPQTREIIANVFDFLKQDAWEIMQLAGDPAHHGEPGRLISKLSEHLNCVRKRTAQAAGVSERTITNILTQRRNGVECKTPFENRRKREKILELNDFTVEVIRTTIDNYKAKHNKMPPFVLLLKTFRKKLNYTGCVTTLRKALSDLGYEFGRHKTTTTREPDAEAIDIAESSGSKIIGTESSESKKTSFKNFFISNALNVTPHKPVLES